MYDSTFDRDMISRCVNALSRNFPAETGDRVNPLSLSVYKMKVCIIVKFHDSLCREGKFSRHKFFLFNEKISVTFSRS